MITLTDQQRDLLRSLSGDNVDGLVVGPSTSEVLADLQARGLCGAGPAYTITARGRLALALTCPTGHPAPPPAEPGTAVVVGTFRVGDTVPEWLFSRTPMNPTSIMPVLQFLRDAVVLLVGDNYWVLPARPNEGGYILGLLSGKDAWVAANDRPVCLLLGMSMFWPENHPDCPRNLPPMRPPWP